MNIERLSRIKKMEFYYDTLNNLESIDYDLHQYNRVYKMIYEILAKYLECGQWQEDYEADEKGLIPKDLKRGVLSQDGLYDLLERFNDTLGE